MAIARPDRHEALAPDHHFHRRRHVHAGVAHLVLDYECRRWFDRHGGSLIGANGQLRQSGRNAGRPLAGSAPPRPQPHELRAWPLQAEAVQEGARRGWHPNMAASTLRCLSANFVSTPGALICRRYNVRPAVTVEPVVGGGDCRGCHRATPAPAAGGHIPMSAQLDTLRSTAGSARSRPTTLARPAATKPGPDRPRPRAPAGGQRPNERPPTSRHCSESNVGRHPVRVQPRNPFPHRRDILADLVRSQARAAAPRLRRTRPPGQGAQQSAVVPAAAHGGLDISRVDQARSPRTPVASLAILLNGHGLHARIGCRGCPRNRCLHERFDDGLSAEA